MWFVVMKGLTSLGLSRTVNAVITVKRQQPLTLRRECDRKMEPRKASADEVRTCWQSWMSTFHVSPVSSASHRKLISLIRISSVPVHTSHHLINQNQTASYNTLIHSCHVTYPHTCYATSAVTSASLHWTLVRHSNKHSVHIWMCKKKIWLIVG